MAEAQAAPEPDWPIPWEEVTGERNGPGAWIEYGLLRALLGVMTRVPDGVRTAMVNGLASFGKRIDSRHADHARKFLTQAYGDRLTAERREELVTAAYRVLFRNVLATSLLVPKVHASSDPSSHYHLDLCDEAERIRREGGGGLFITGHMGAWEAIGPGMGFEPIYAVTRPPKNRPLSIHLQRTREVRGGRAIHRHGAIQGVARVLAAGGYVLMLIDQRARGRTVVAPFFGRPAHCERSVPVLIRRARVPVMMLGCFEAEQPFHFDVRIPRVFSPDELAALSPVEMMTAINGELERMILSQPEQYMWLHDRYRGAPEPAPEAPESAEAPEIRT